MYEWVVEGLCQYVCAAGYYRNGNNCLRCSTNLNCIPGFYQHDCTSSEDARCVACTNELSIGEAWSDYCEFECISGYFRSSQSECTKCNNDLDNCSLGFYTTPCNSTHDTDCLECSPPGDAGSFTWVESNSTACESTCCYGYYRPDNNLGSSTCIPVPPPPEPEPLAFVVVSTALAMNNTAEKVCNKLPVLLQALSDAMKAVMGGENGLCFITNVTAFDGSPCVDNVCPQCENVSLGLYIDLFMSHNTSNSRRLLGSGGGVSLSTVSTSTSPVVSSSIQQSSPPPATLQSALTETLVSVAPELSPSDVVAVVSSVAVTPPPPVVHESGSTKDRRALLFRAGTSVGIVLLVVVVVSVLVCIEIIRDSRGDRRSMVIRKKEVGVVCEPIWMPSIRLRQHNE